MNQSEEQIAALVDAFLLNYFKDHSAEPLTPAEWRAATVACVLSFQAENSVPMAWLQKTNLLEARLEDAERSGAEALRVAVVAAKAEARTEAIASLQSFVDSEPTLGDVDKKDVPGVIRAIQILEP